MALLCFNGVGIRAMSACVPKNKVNNITQTQYFSPEAVSAVVDKTGVKERRVAQREICSSDLCFEAAEKLISDNDIDKEEINAIIFISQTPDYRMPATSIILQHRLGLPVETIAFDVNLGCTGFVHGLYIAYSMLQNDKINKVLLLNGETRSRVYSPKDRSVAFLFGDAGSATLIEKSDSFGDSFFSLGTGGEYEDYIKIPGGGYRNPSSYETLEEKVVDEYGNIRSGEHAYMRGEDVFGLFIKIVPRDIRRLYEYSGVKQDEIDYLVMHEGSNYLSSYLKKRLKFPDHKVPTIMPMFGNTSSVSIPLNMVVNLQNMLQGQKKLLMTVMGVGMAWASCIVNTKNCNISQLVEV